MVAGVPVICIIALAFIASPVAFADQWRGPVPCTLRYTTQHERLCLCLCLCVCCLCCLSWLQPHAEGQSQAALAATCRAQAVASGAEVAAGPREHSPGTRKIHANPTRRRAGQVRVVPLLRWAPSVAPARPDALHAVAFSFTTRCNSGVLSLLLGDGNGSSTCTASALRPAPATFARAR